MEFEIIKIRNTSYGFLGKKNQQLKQKNNVAFISSTCHSCSLARANIPQPPNFSSE